MIAYLDTHVMPALAAGKVRQLGPDAARLISKADLLLSPIVLLELEYLYEIKRSRLSARDLYEKGIEVTARTGDQHARSELQAALDMLPI